MDGEPESGLGPPEADRENAVRVLTALSELGAGLAGEWLVDEVAERPVTTIGDHPRVDVLTAAWSVRFQDPVPGSRTFEAEDGG